jgi:hypothetical protein
VVGHGEYWNSVFKFSLERIVNIDIVVFFFVDCGVNFLLFFRSMDLLRW